MPIEEFFYANLNQHLLPNNEQSSSSDAKDKDIGEMLAKLESKKVKPIKPADLAYKAIRGDNRTISDNFFAILKKNPSLLTDADTTEKQILAKNKLKFHVSLPENQYAEGWDTVTPILIAKGVAQFKIPNQNERMSSAEGQYGKDITIYADKNPEKGVAEWEEILTAITKGLVEADIPPGYKTARTPAESDRYDEGIIGSKYISYRYDVKNPPPAAQDPCTRLRISTIQPYEPQIFGQINNTEQPCCPKCNIL